MILRRRTVRRQANRELEAAKLRTSVSRSRAQQEFRRSSERLEESRKVARLLAWYNSDDYGDLVQAILNRDGTGA